MSARWLAALLGRPFITLDLASVMSSYLGKTGANIRSVLEYAKSVESVLLLDEFDSIAKKRDDDSDVGELKRLVTVLLQEVDDWPSTSLLIAATNHGELLDPAVWRRFDDVLEFRAPSAGERMEALQSLFGDDVESLNGWMPLLVNIWEGDHSAILVAPPNGFVAGSRLLATPYLMCFSPGSVTTYGTALQRTASALPIFCLKEGTVIARSAILWGDHEIPFGKVEQTHPQPLERKS